MNDEISGGNEVSSETSDVDLLAEGEDSSADETEEKTEETTEPESDPVQADEDEAEKSEEDETPEPESEPELTDEEKEIEAKIVRPSWEEIKTKFPDLAKNREFREIYFRDQQFGELFPSLNDAREAVDKARHLDYLDEKISDGDPRIILESLNPQTAEKIAVNFLDSLYAFDDKLFVKATSGYLSRMLNGIADYADKSNDQHLKTSVLNISKHLFGKFELPRRIGGRHPEIEQEKRRLQEERNKDLENLHNEFRGGVEKIVYNQLNKLIRDGLNVRNEYLANSIVKDTIEELKNRVRADQNFVTSMKSIYDQAIKSRFSGESKARVVSAYLARTRGLALKVRAEIRAAALNKPSVNGEPPKPKRVEGKNGPAKVQSKGDNSKDLKDTRKMSDLDILNMP